MRFSDSRFGSWFGAVREVDPIMGWGILPL